MSKTTLSFTNGASPALNSTNMNVLAGGINDANTYYTAGGTANAITITTGNGNYAYADGVIINFKASNDNTGAVTINIDSQGLKDLRDADGVAFAGGEIESGKFYTFVYNSTAGNFTYAPKGGLKPWSDAYDGTNLEVKDYKGSNVVVKVGDYVYHEGDKLYLGSIPVWTKETDMSVLPSSDGWTLDQSGGSITLNSGILNITTTASADRASYFLVTTFSATPTKRVEARMRVKSSAGTANKPSQEIAIYDGTRAVRLFVTETNIYYWNTSSTAVSIATGDFSSDFVVVRIEFKSSFGLKVYVNGTQVGTTIAYTNLFASAASSRFIFGDTVSTPNEENSDFDWDYFNYQTDLESNPDPSYQEIPPRSEATDISDITATIAGDLKFLYPNANRTVSTGFISKEDLIT